MNEIDTLLDRFATLAGSPRNRRLADAPPRISFHIGLGRSVWKDIVGFSLIEYFGKPEVALAAQLRWKLFWHDNIPDDTVIEPTLGLDFGVALEPSLFGVGSHFSGDTDPMYAEPVIAGHADLARLKTPDFFSSGLMPKIHAMHKAMAELAGPVPVRFPGWARGPWSVACMLRGFNELYMDLSDDPQFVKDLLAFIVESRISWETQRCSFLGTDPRDQGKDWQYVVYRKISSGDQFNDEVDGNLFSPATYADFIFPAEKSLRDFYGSLRYYHSCGNMTPLLPTLRGLKPELMHISQATDVAVADSLFDQTTAFQCCMHPVDEVTAADEEKMRSAIRLRLDAMKTRKAEIWADALYQGGGDTLGKALDWLAAARETYRG
ncbi:MAG: hypothetical protein A2413_14520 [Treponema sp. RIFOXYC1_FULL_61_9]|nr:MAG: hypothetical protein A2001_15095 [Treponema sp. GWC1_61_84]OHE73902.1 MAG: hypothetical protein A2413_14520 [Treponema sp. RIFOXYC1_FULL_61_9]